MNTAEWRDIGVGEVPAPLMRVGLGQTPLKFGRNWYMHQDGRTLRAAGIGQGPTSAAEDMNSAIDANGFRAADQQIYLDFQQWYNAQSGGNLSEDGFPGSDTITALLNTLSTENVTPSSKIVSYNWSGAHGCSGYDGTNAPTLTQWCSGGAGPMNDPCCTGGGGGGGGGGPSPTPAAATTNYAPWIIGGAVVAAGGVIGYAYWHRNRRRR